MRVHLTFLLALVAVDAQPASLTWIPGSTKKVEQMIGDCDYTALARTGQCVATTSQTSARARRGGGGVHSRSAHLTQRRPDRTDDRTQRSGHDTWRAVRALHDRALHARQRPYAFHLLHALYLEPVHDRSDAIGLCDLGSILAPAKSQALGQGSLARRRPAVDS